MMDKIDAESDITYCQLIAQRKLDWLMWRQALGIEEATIDRPKVLDKQLVPIRKYQRMLSADCHGIRDPDVGAAGTP